MTIEKELKPASLQWYDTVLSILKKQKDNKHVKEPKLKYQ